MRLELLLSVLSVLLCACGSISPATDGSVDDPPDGGGDGGGGPVAPAPAPGRELAPAAGRLSGGPWTVDVQLGAAFDQTSAAGGGLTVQGGAPLIP